MTPEQRSTTLLGMLVIAAGDTRRALELGDADESLFKAHVAVRIAKSLVAYLEEHHVDGSEATS